KAHLGESCYRQGSRLTELSRDKSRVQAIFADGGAASADLLVASDGVNSTARRLLSGEDEGSAYSGYVAWRGLENEGELPPSLVEPLAERFTLFTHPGLQMLCYLVPSADGATEPGRRRVNWVWYVNAPETELDRVLTGASGMRYRSFLPASDVHADVDRKVKDAAARELPSVFADLVSASRIFMQPVQDVRPQQRLHGRALLLGDAAGTVRPHTAAGTSKAFGDAALLAAALKDWRSDMPLDKDKLEQWSAIRTQDLQATARRGIALAAGSGLGG
ncbi:MAG: FAD-dependent monooxygenase, partial [Pseudomonadota bacterium]